MDFMISYMVVIKFLMMLVGLYTAYMAVIKYKFKDKIWNIIAFVNFIIFVFVPITHKTNTTKIEKSYDYINQEVKVTLPERVKPEKSFYQIDKEIKHIKIEN